MHQYKLVDFDIVIIGGGPAGTGLLLKSLKDGEQSSFFNNNIALIENSPHLVVGNISKYIVNSDTYSNVFLECLEGSTQEFVDISELKNEIDFIKSFEGKSIPLNKLESYLMKLGIELKRALEEYNKCKFFMNSMASKIIRKNNGTYEIFISGSAKPLIAKNIILATGGIPENTTDKSTELLTNFSIQNYQFKSLHSDTILKSGLSEHFTKKLLKNPKVVILGGSHSAFSVAHYLLNLSHSNLFGKGDIKIWCNKLPKIYFNTEEDAIKAEYKDFTINDICPITKKVYRLSGLRMDGRELYLKMLGLTTSNKENRVHLSLFENNNLELEKDITNASLIVLAYGYKLNIVPFYNEQGKKIKFQGEFTNHWVNDRCEILDENNKVISNVYATGLATGFIPKGDLGGEPSFEGQTNGIWYYQNAIAERIINNLSDEYTPDKP
jgi:hypothetical protein